MVKSSEKIKINYHYSNKAQITEKCHIRSNVSTNSLVVILCFSKMSCHPVTHCCRTI